MKRLIIYIILFVGFWVSAQAQLSLQCPPCRPVQGCDQCWASEQEAQDNGCNTTARLSTQLLSNDNETAINDLQVYPNPSCTGFFTIESTFDMDGEISIIDPIGRSYGEYQLDGVRYFELKDALPDGMYILLYRKGEMYFTKKLIVNHN